jgi:2-polyprenyl-3-methyl-5-hydroxy-6-metoxy-1,4-benzoquinol methylase
VKELVRQQGRFGHIRILERESDGARLYCIDSSVQTMIQADGVSMFGYVHAAKLLLMPARKILIVGGAGGSLATMLARTGRAVTVLDVDPVAEALARDYFGLDPSVRWVTGDLPSFYSMHHEVFDAVCIDACDADGLVGGFDDPDMLIALVNLACPEGSLVLNLVQEDGAPPWGPLLAAEIAARGLNVTRYHAEEGWEGNELLHIRARGPTDGLRVADVQRRPPEARTYLLSLRAHSPRRRRDASL